MAEEFVDQQRPDVTDELTRAGGSFGTLIARVGGAVAKTQERLDQTGAETAEALANTLVDVIAVQEQVYDENGTRQDTESHVLELPLITQTAPTFHWWREVRVQGTFFAREVTTRSDSSSRIAGASISLRGGRGLSASGFVAGTDVSVGQASDVSVGQMRMNALLEARDDVSIPLPRRSVRGPRLSIFLGQTTTLREEPAGADPSSRILGRRLDATVELRAGRDEKLEDGQDLKVGAPVPGASISIEAQGLDWRVDGANRDEPVVTNGEGRIPIVLERRFEDPDEDAAPRDFVLTARVGLISADTTVKL